MDGTIEKRHGEIQAVPTRLGPIKSIGRSNPLTIWEEDGKKIKLLTETLESMRRNGQPGSERISGLLEVLKWKRCDLGRRLLQSTPAGDGQSVWSELIEANKQRSRAQAVADLSP